MFAPPHCSDAGDGVLATITVFETKEAAVESTAAAASWVRANIAHLVPNAPQVTGRITSGVGAGVPA